MVKHLLTMWETWVRSLSEEDPLEKEIVTTPVLLPGKSRRHKELDTTKQLHFQTIQN